MNRHNLIPIAMILTATANAACLPGSEEIGDTGPDDTTVCRYLESHYPNADIRIVNRDVLQADRVSVAFQVDGKPQRLEYQLSGFRWALKNEGLLANQ